MSAFIYMLSHSNLHRISWKLTKNIGPMKNSPLMASLRLEGSLLEYTHAQTIVISSFRIYIRPGHVRCW